MKIINQIEIDKDDDQLKRQLLGLLYHHLFTSLPALVVLGSIIVWQLWNKVSQTHLITWYSVFMSVLIIRALLAVWFYQTQEKFEWYKWHYLLFILNSSAIAILWGICCSYLMPSDPLSQALVLIILAGVTAGAVLSLMPSYLASTLYGILSIAPVVTKLLTQYQNSTYISLAVVLITYLLFLLVVTQRGHKLFVNNLKLSLALRESEARFHKSFDYAAIGMALISLEGNFLKVNQALVQLLGYMEGEILTLSLNDIIYPEDLYKDNTSLEKLLNGESHDLHNEIRFMQKNGNVIWTLTSRALLRDAQKNPLYFILQVLNIDAERKAEEELKYIAYHDALTNLDNRTMLEIKFEQALQYSANNKKILAVIFLDLDHFKEINDHLGHDAGDRLLVLVGERLNRLKRRNDILARLGGDEFVLILTDLLSVDEIDRIAKQICDTISKKMRIDTHEFNITTSMGISLYPQDALDLHTLLRYADRALYQAKIRRDNFVFYKAEETPTLTEG